MYNNYKCYLIKDIDWDYKNVFDVKKENESSKYF